MLLPPREGGAGQHSSLLPDPTQHRPGRAGAAKEKLEWVGSAGGSVDGVCCVDRAALSEELHDADGSAVEEPVGDIVAVDDC